MAIAVFPRTGLVGAGAPRRLRAGHWSTNRLAVLMAGFDVSGLHPLDSSRQKFLTGTSTKVRSGAIVLDTITSYVDLDRFSNLPVDRATVLVIRRKHDTTNRAAHLIGTELSAGSERFEIHVPYSDGVVYWDFGGFASPNRVSVSGLSFAGIQRWTFVAGTHGMAIYLNGVQKASSGTAVTRSAAASTAWLNRGNDAGNFRGDLQDVYFLAILDAEWTPTQIQMWDQDPWLMFEQPRVVPLTGVAAGGPTFNALLVSP